MRRVATTLLSFGALCAASTLSTTSTSSTSSTSSTDLAAFNCKGTPGDIFQAFLKSLSPQSLLYLPGSVEFNATTLRWSELATPTADVVVVPGTEGDIAKIVNQANKCNLPILAFNGVHGAITSLGQMTGGVAISLAQLSSVVVSSDGQSATIGGGTFSKTVTDTLWAAGKQTVTGTCECVSYLGPALGGGHGWLQGHHGLVSDQFLSMTVVFADGVMQTIDSSSDVWWAMKGAGQNFGIVTSVNVKIYDIVHTNWAIETLIFNGSQVEQVYETANQYLQNLPADFINWSYWLNIPQIDPNMPIILFYMIQEGVNAVDPIYTSPFHALGPISITPQSGTYRDLAGWTEIALDSPPCQKTGLANPRFPIYLQGYNATAQKIAYDMFAANVGGSNSSFSSSIFMFEAYPQEGVQAIDPTSAAFAFRNETLLAAPLITYLSTGPQIDAQAKTLGDELRNIIYQGSGRQELHAYVNYANGDENPQSWFGYEQWRWDRLRQLKSSYDPTGRFNFYAPIV